MTLFSPAKILVVLVVAVVVLGPDKLPKVARQVGALWGEFRRLRQRLESDVRGNFPDLPSTDTITQAVRSPISFLDSLADTHAAERAAAVPGPTDGVAGEQSSGVVQAAGGSDRPPGAVRTDEGIPVPGTPFHDPPGAVHLVRSEGRDVPDDPSLN